jgi:serine/threonine-protein kinase
VTDPFEGLNAALGGHYIIDRELGRGGMALVYLARDLRHERFVALKTLRPEIAMALGRERFLREIKLAARLQHPNILPVYDSGDASGTLYYVMPFVEGESLRDRLDREAQLSMDDALKIARDVAAALAYAHTHDVVHRDIKPENIMLSGGQAIVTDFGIARAVSAAGGDKLTETGLAIGTPSYMSPEQASGMGQVDRRSDIYSLACVLYETLAGQPPFTGPTAQAILARHSLDSVPRLRVVRATIPDALEKVIERALEKIPADRYSTAEQFADALSTASTGRISRVTASQHGARRSWRRSLPVAVGATALMVVGWILLGGGNRRAGASRNSLDPHRVAVLYFADQSSDSSLGHVADGLTESVIDALGSVRPLDVVSRNGVAQFRNSDVPRDSVARALSAGTLLSGAVELEAGGRLRVTTRLIDGASGAEYARHTFALPRTDLLAIRDSATQDIAGFLRSRLGEELELRERRGGTVNVEAWALVQQAELGRKHAEQLARQDRPAAARALGPVDSVLTAAERADPEWSEPTVLRAWVAADAARFTADRDEKISLLSDGLRHAERAFRRHADDPRVLEIRGTLRYALWRLESAPAGQTLDGLARDTRADLERAVQIDPTLASAYATLSLLFHYQKDVVSSVLAARNAYQADAFLRDADGVLNRLFHSSYNIMQFAEARRWCAEGARRFPSDYRFVDCELRLMSTPQTAPDVARAWRLEARIDSLAPAARHEFYRRRTDIFVAAALARAGQRDSARRVLVRSRADASIDPEQELVGFEAIARTFLGDADTAIALLKRYVAANPGHSFEVGGDVHWWWRDLRSHPEFQQVLALTKSQSVAH